MVIMESRIEIDSRIQHGKPVIRGARVLIQSLLADLRKRAPQQEVTCRYGITDQDINAALAFTATCRDVT